MRDLKADWRKWTRAERFAAALFGLTMSAIIPTMILFAQG